MQKIVVLVLVAVAYFALGVVSKLVAYSPADAWTVWLSNGVVLGPLLAMRRDAWSAVLAGGFAGATAFAFYIGVSPLESLGYGVIEVVSTGGAALLVSRLTPLPMMLARPRELAVLIFAGALPLSVIGGLIATLWHIGTGGNQAGSTLRLWIVSGFCGTLLVAPVIIAWARFRPRRSGGMTMPAFSGGAVACALFLGTMEILFDTNVEQRFGSLGEGLTYAPILFMALVAMVWGTRGATLAAFIGALIAIVNTAQNEGPFAVTAGVPNEAEVAVQAYVLAIALTGLLIAVLAAGQRGAMREAREWQTRFNAAIGAHRLLAYEWDPVTNRIVLTGDSTALLNVPPQNLATLADWLALVPADDRERVATAFDERVRGQGEADGMTYAVVTPSGRSLVASDEARAIRDHDGQLHRVVGIVRIAAPVAEGTPA